MKDSETCKQLTAMDESERFQANFISQQADIEEQLAAADAALQADLQQHFAKISSSLLTLQKLYSASAPFLRIYDRKKAQDTLQDLQTKIQESEARLIPRKKFVFKGKKDKRAFDNSTATKNGGEKKEETIGIDFIDGPGTNVLRNREGETIVLKAEEVTGKALLLACLQNCKLQVLGAPSTLHIAKVSNCSVSCGPVASSVFVEEARSCYFQLACQQLRIHDTIDSEFRVHVTSKAIIEDSCKLRFGEFNFKYPTIEEDFKISRLTKQVNNWRDIDDFNWLAVGQPSPNWSIISADER